jgi:outer membrane protein TolC
MKIKIDIGYNECLKLVFISLILALSFCCKLRAQDSTMYLTLDDVIEIPKTQSIDALVAAQVFQQSFWEFKMFRAQKLPSLVLDMGLINYGRSTTNREYNLTTGDYQYYETDNNTSSGRLTLNQNIPLTGGTITAGFDLLRNDDFRLGSWDYASNPSISLNQPLFAFNKFKWDNLMQPKKYEIAKAKYNQSLEDISLKAVGFFFNLAGAQVNAEVLRKNLLNADTLYKISQGRYQMGRISENDLLQMELNYLNSQTALNNAQIALYDAKSKLLSFLRINTNQEVILIIPDSVPDLEVSLSQVIEEAKENNPQMLILDNLLLQAKQQVAQTKADKGINANLVAAIGLSRVDSMFPEIITNKNNIADYQNVQLGIKIPIVDWGRNKGNYKIAMLNEEIVQNQVDQSIVDFEQNVILQGMIFNQQKTQFSIAQKSQIVAEKRYIVSKYQFLIGKIDVLDLNVAQKDHDAEKASYINALREYWNAYYSLRKTTLYDFIKKTKIDNLKKDKF